MTTITTAATISYQVEWIREVPGYDERNIGGWSVHLYIVEPSGDKLLVRCTDVVSHRRLREANRVPASVTDLQVLTQNLEPLVRGMRAERKFDHFEIALGQMPQKKEGGQSVEFPASAFEQGTTGGKVK